MAEEGPAPMWAYELVHGDAHPDHKPPLTTVGEASDEAVQKEEDTQNAIYAADHVDSGAAPKAATAKAEQQNLEEKTVAELKAIADEKGIHVPWDANKADIIKVIKKAK